MLDFKDDLKDECLEPECLDLKLALDDASASKVPQNCPRTYKLASFDPDGDHVRCRYGNVPNIECDTCNSIPGFQLDQDSCTLHYQFTSADYRSFG
ncbi:hypothetical protein AMECASPLE_035606, partial [Ameca splendens]